MGSPHDNRACRRLFDDGGDPATRRTLDKMQEDSSRSWNYDFGRDRPMQGRYQWQRCGDDDKRTSSQWRCWGDASPGSAYIVLFFFFNIALYTRPSLVQAGASLLELRQQECPELMETSWGIFVTLKRDHSGTSRAQIDSALSTADGTTRSLGLAE
ncbi:hypothetical protein HPB51_023241 [Rhipicephalus microplus]|uniref:Cyclin-dependent kinase inhibitor domain-containing protein n=1 Tax=Rhipicephalus microplus TaxID=6941 RepID=A0A9J6ECA1_RHIMP|nr:hypothetical protein HPB51_023241 [Rhipicephalus microplus]